MSILEAFIKANGRLIHRKDSLAYFATDATYQELLDKVSSKALDAYDWLIAGEDRHE